MLSWFCHVQLFATLWTVAHQAPLSMGFCRREYWSGLPCPPAGDPPDSGTEPVFQPPARAGRFFTPSATWGAPFSFISSQSLELNLSKLPLLCSFCLPFSLVQFSHSVVSDSLRPCGLQLARLPCAWLFPGKNAGVGCHALFQGIFPTQGWAWIS